MPLTLIWVSLFIYMSIDFLSIRQSPLGSEHVAMVVHAFRKRRDYP